MNTQYFERLNEQSRLQIMSKADLKEVLKCECGLICPIHSPKRNLIEAILDHKYGKESNNEKSVG